MAYTTSGASGFGIKEVADVGFYDIGTVTVDPSTGAVTGTPLFVLDTLKVSTIENTAEQADAKGGKGNAPLIIWDYGREITITLQDAVLTQETLSMMFENNAKDAGNEIVISANTFPGTYAIVGKTFARDTNGKDSLFTWFVPKAKVNSEVTLTMEAEGDPTVFDMNLRVLRDSDGTMVKLIRDTSSASEATAKSYDATLAFESDAQGQLYIVKVVDGDEPVSGANVKVENYTTTTDVTGYAYFKNANVTDKTVTVSKEGYVSTTGEVKADTVVEIALTTA